MQSPPTLTRPVRQVPLWPWALGLAFGLRTLIALSRLDELELERYNASLGWALLKGLPLDPTHLPVIPHLRGSVVFGVLLAPILWLFGANLFAVKFLAVLWGSATAALATALAQRHLGRGPAWLVLVLTVLAPPAFQCVDVLALGSHADTLLLILLPLWWCGKHRGARLGPLVGGALIGIGALFSMQFLVALPAIALFWWYGGPGSPTGQGVRSRARATLGRILLFLVGAVPFLALIPYITRKATLVNQSIESRFLPFGWSGAWERLRQLATHDLRRSWLFEERGYGWLSYLLFSLMIGGAVLALPALRPTKWLRRGAPAWSPADRLELFAWLHVLSLFAAYAISDFKLNLLATGDGMGSRYLMPIWPALAFLAAGLPLWLGRHSRLPLALPLAAMIAVPALLALRPLINPSIGTRQPAVSATEFYNFYDHIRLAAPAQNLPARLAWVSKLDPNWPQLQPLLYGKDFAANGPSLASEIQFELRSTADLPAQVRPFALTGLGLTVSARMRGVLLDGSGAQPLSEGFSALLLAERCSNFARFLSDEDFFWYSAGTGMWVTEIQIGESRVVRALTEHGPDPRVGDYDPVIEGLRFLANWPLRGRRALALGMGFKLGNRLTPYEVIFDPVLAGISRVPADLLPDYVRGIGLGYRSRFVESGYWPPRHLAVEELLPPAAREAFVAALAENPLHLGR